MVGREPTHVVDPVDGEAAERLAAAPVEVLDEARDPEGRHVGGKVGHLLGQGARPEDEERLRSFGHQPPRTTSTT